VLAALRQDPGEQLERLLVLGQDRREGAEGDQDARRVRAPVARLGHRLAQVVRHEAEFPAQREQDRGLHEQPDRVRRVLLRDLVEGGEQVAVRGDLAVAKEPGQIHALTQQPAGLPLPAARAEPLRPVIRDLIRLAQIAQLEPRRGPGQDQPSPQLQVW
jgi:hypothetical protein